jgi:hypothetical protein
MNTFLRIDLLSDLSITKSESEYPLSVLFPSLMKVMLRSEVDLTYFKSFFRAFVCVTVRSAIN